jgi:hypothetical protein
MGLDVLAPDPPRLSFGQDADDYDDVTVQTTDYRREELQGFLDDGAWERSFDEWAEDAEIDEATWQVVLDLGLIERYDFFWDDFANRVGYHTPGIPQDWKERGLHPALSSWAQVSAINAGLAELGGVVSDVLKAEYVDWDADYEAPEDLPDFS